jgi:hypothetical protein
MPRAHSVPALPGGGLEGVQHVLFVYRLVRVNACAFLDLVFGFTAERAKGVGPRVSYCICRQMQAHPALPAPAPCSGCLLNVPMGGHPRLSVGRCVYS